jgi:endonuclease/exonuclease/phosphatase (EEP) superfamily protein YafD
VAWDDLEVLAILDAFTVLLWPIGVVIGVVAAARRKWALAAASVAVAGVFVALALPELAAAEPLASDVGHAARFRLFDANVTQSNLDMAGYAAQIRSFRPDVVALEETHAADERQLAADGAWRALPYRYQHDDPGSRGVIVASRYPLAPVRVSKVDGLSYLWRTAVHFPGGSLPLWVVHTTAPVPPDWRDWSLELAGLDRTVRAARLPDLVLVGDLNATWGNKEFRSILRAGLVDAAAARGHALDMTWPQVPVVPPLVRIDHVLSTRSVAVTEIATEPGPGSQHRALVATLSLPRAPAPGRP